MKKILIGTALAGAIVGAFASISLAARIDAGSGNVIAVDMR